MNNQVTPEKKHKFYYGWIVFAVCFLMVFVSLGFGSSTKGTYLKAVTDTLGLDRGPFTINDSLRYITTAILSFFFGAIVTKLKPRRMVALGFSFLVISFTVYSFATDYWMFYIGGAFLGGGISWTTTTIVGYIVEKWFTNNKGTLMGILLAANGLGGVASEWIITPLVYTDEIGSGWSNAYRITAIIFAVTAIIVVAFLRNEPADMGLEPLGQNAVKKKKRGLDWVGYEEKDITKKSFFWISGICVFLMGFILQAMVNVSKPCMYDAGLSKEFVIVVFSAHSLVLAFSKIFCGWLYDHVGIRITFGMCSAAAIISILALAFTTKDSIILPYVYSLVSSFGLPLETVMIPLLVSQLFGKKPFAKAMGYYLAFNASGYACGVPLVNLWYDHFGSYKGILIILVCVMALASVVAQFSIAHADKKRVQYLESLSK